MQLGRSQARPHAAHLTSPRPLPSARALKPPTSARSSTQQQLQPPRASPSDDPSPSSQQGKTQTQETGAALKAVWYAAEGLGKLVGLSKPAAAAAASTAPAAGRMSWEQIIASLRADYDSSYFVSGKGDMAAYADDCEFSDPFVAFRGKDRFQQNVGNLGGMMRDIKLDVYDWQEQAGDKVVTRWRFSCILALPWRPLLAAAGSTTHVFSPATGLVVQHIEAWDVEPGRVVAQLFRPAAKIPTTAAETFFLAASDGDAKGIWFAVTPLLIKLSLPLAAASTVWRLAAGGGDGAAGDAAGAVQGASAALLVSALVTEVVKFAQGMQGGETGTGGRF